MHALAERKKLTLNKVTDFGGITGLESATQLLSFYEVEKPGQLDEHVDMLLGRHAFFADYITYIKQGISFWLRVGFCDLCILGHKAEKALHLVQVSWNKAIASKLSEWIGTSEDAKTYIEDITLSLIFAETIDVPLEAQQRAMKAGWAHYDGAKILIDEPIMIGAGVDFLQTSTEEHLEAIIARKTKSGVYGLRHLISAVRSLPMKHQM